MEAMLEKYLIHTIFPIVDSKAQIETFNNIFKNNSFAVVKNDSGTFDGIINSKKINSKKETKAAEYLGNMIKADSHQYIIDLLKICYLKKTDEIALFDKNKFIGIVCKNDMLHWIYNHASELNEEINAINQFVYYIDFIIQQKFLKSNNYRKSSLLNKIKNDFPETKLIHTLSYDIHSKLNNIKILYEKIQNLLTYDSNNLKYLSDAISNMSKQLSDTISEIIEISALELGKINLHTDYFDVKETALSIIQNYILHRNSNEIQIINLIEKCWGNITLETDKTKFTKIFKYLLDNAFKYTLTGTIEIGCFSKNNDVIFYIKDTGIGIESKYHKEIFEPFKQLKNKNLKGGIGLGLSIAKNFIKLLNGKIWIESESDQSHGTTFFFSFPVHNNNNLVSFNQNIITNNHHKILIATAEIIDAVMLAEHFENINGFDIKIARNKKNILNNLQKINSFNLLFLDYNLPEINYTTLISTLRQKNDKIFIIAYTANVNNQIKKEISDIGFDEILLKPLTETEINRITDSFFKNYFSNHHP